MSVPLPASEELASPFDFTEAGKVLEGQRVKYLLKVTFVRLVL